MLVFTAMATVSVEIAIIVRKEETVKLGNSSKEMIQELLYGSQCPEYLEFIPWEGEDLDSFSKRAELLGTKTILLSGKTTALKT